MSDFRLILNHDPADPPLSNFPPVKEEVVTSNTVSSITSFMTASSLLSSSIDHKSDYSNVLSFPVISSRYSPYPTPSNYRLDTSSTQLPYSASHSLGSNYSNDIKPFHLSTYSQYPYPVASDYYTSSSTSSSTASSSVSLSQVHPFSFKQAPSRQDNDTETISPVSSPSPPTSPYNQSSRLLSPSIKSISVTSGSTAPPNAGTPLIDGEEANKPGKRKLVVTADLLKMKQMNAAMKIGVPPSTFSKRWRESLPQRTWPYRNHRRIEKNIKMLKSMQQRGQDVTAELQKMKEQRDLNLAPAVIDVYEEVNEEYLLRADSVVRQNTTHI